MFYVAEVMWGWTCQSLLSKSRHVWQCNAWCTQQICFWGNSLNVGNELHSLKGGHCSENITKYGSLLLKIVISIAEN